MNNITWIPRPFMHLVHFIFAEQDLQRTQAHRDRDGLPGGLYWFHGASDGTGYCSCSLTHLFLFSSEEDCGPPMALLASSSQSAVCVCCHQRFMSTFDFVLFTLYEPVKVFNIPLWLILSLCKPCSFFIANKFLYLELLSCISC